MSRPKKISKELERDMKVKELKLHYFQVRHLIGVIQKVLTTNRFPDYRTVIDLQLILVTLNDLLKNE